MKQLSTTDTGIDEVTIYCTDISVDEVVFIADTGVDEVTMYCWYQGVLMKQLYTADTGVDEVDIHHCCWC